MTEKTYQEADRLQITIKRIESILHDFTYASNDEISSDIYVLIETNPSLRYELKDFLVKKLAEYKKEFDEL